MQRSGVGLGDLVCFHRELVRRGVHVHGARVSADGRLGRGEKVNAVLARENAWTSKKGLRLLGGPLGPGQLGRSFGHPPLQVTACSRTSRSFSREARGAAARDAELSRLKMLMRFA